MKAPQRVVWMEGMEMFPQHLQQQDLFHERLLASRLAQSVPNDWGVGALEVDMAALGAGQFRVLRFEGVLPDGLPLVFGTADAGAPPARSIEGHLPPTQRILDVYLGVPRERDGNVNYIEANTSGSRARYIIESRAMMDNVSGGTEHQVSFGRPNTSLLFGDESREDFESIKIGEVLRDGSGAPIFNDLYVPPILRIGASPFLVGGLRRVLALLVAKQRELARARRQGEGASVEFGIGDVTRFLQLYALNEAIPLIQHLSSVTDLPARQAYMVLVQLVGRLSTFNIEADPTQVPAYTFNGLGPVFEELFARITALLHTTVREQCVTLSLQLREGRFMTALEDDRLPTATEVLLGVRSDAPEAQLVDRFTRYARIASVAELPYLIRANASGIPVRFNPRPPAEIPVRAGVVYFSIPIHDPNWHNALRNRSLAVFVPSPMEVGTSIELYAVPRPER